MTRIGLFYPQLHALWHILATFGLYLLALVIIQRRFKVLGLGPKVAFTHRFILVPVIVPASEASKFIVSQEQSISIVKKEL
jgi:hypothetical protein